jgi:hypothetical protein
MRKPPGSAHRRTVTRINDIAGTSAQNAPVRRKPKSMATKNHPASKFRCEITALIAEVEAYLRSTPADLDREFDYQREAFRERCHQAKKLVGRFGPTNRSEWSLRSGDAHRIEESLKLSLAYFRSRTLT